MIQLAWRFLRFQKNSALAQWFAARTADGRGGTRKTMIVALARKLLIALWRLATTGQVPQGVGLRPVCTTVLLLGCAERSSPEAACGASKARGLTANAQTGQP
jgi:hypothetical protein